MQEPPRRRALWPWLVIPLVLVVAGAIGALLAVRANNGDTNAQAPPVLTVVAAPRQTQPVRAAASGSAKSVTVPDVRGEKLSDAQKAIREVGLVADLTRVSSSSKKNTVVGQAPAPGATASPGDHVLLNISFGPQKEGKRHGKGRGHGDGGDEGG